MANIPPREIILAKAGELFHRKGYSSVTVDEIISASGLPRAEFHNNFSNKSSIGKMWLERLSKRMRIMHEAFMERPGDKDRRIKKYFYSMRSWMETNGWRACQFANAAACIDPETEPDLALLIDQYKRDQRKFFIEMVGSIVGEADAQRLGTAVFLIYSGAMTEAQNLKALWPFDDGVAVAEQICEIES